MVNKVKDVFEASKLYHHEMVRTQNINREMLMDLSKINSDYEAAVDRNTSMNLHLNLSQL